LQNHKDGDLVYTDWDLEVPNGNSGCCLSARFRPLPARRGARRAAMAIAHTMLVIGCRMRKTGRGCYDLGGNDLEQINQGQHQRYYPKRLQRLGLKVTVEPVPEAA